MATKKDGLTKVPICLYGDKASAQAAMDRFMEGFAALLKEHGALAGVVAVGLAHRTPTGDEMLVSIEGSGVPKYVRFIQDKALNMSRGMQ